MSDLLHIGLSGLRTYRNALTATGDNVANAETPGYARREIHIREGVSGGQNNPIYIEDLKFGGVEAKTVGRAWDMFRAADSRYAAGTAARAETRSRWLTNVETALDDGPTGVGKSIGAFFNSATLLAAAPDDRLGRIAMLNALDGAAGSIRTTATALSRVADGVAEAAKLEVEGLNRDLAALTEVNVALRQAGAGRTSRASLEDERDRLIDSISARIDVSVSLDSVGVATLTLGGATSVTLVDSVNRAVIGMTSATDGRIALTLSANGTTSPLPATSGTLAGLVDVAASTADKRQTLEAIAAEFATQLNAWSAAGLDADGNPGAPLLDASDGARSIAALVSDPDLVAAATPGGAENGNLLALDALRGANGVERKWAALVSSQAQALSSARSEASVAATRRDLSFAARDEISGVDLDREAAELLRFQQAYNGSAKIIQIARETIQAILDII